MEAYLFILTTLLTVFLFYKARRSNLALVVIIGWMLLQGFICLNGFYKVPTRFPLMIGPPMLLIAVLFLTKKGRSFIDKLNIRTLTILHVIRIPVEAVLWALFIHKLIPQAMTFEGRNWDIISGITAPLLYFVNNRKLLLIWNFICLGLLINIVAIAILSAPTPLQHLAFNQPNVAVFQFPYVWLPAVIVPLVFFSHLVAIRRLLT